MVYNRIRGYMGALKKNRMLKLGYTGRTPGVRVVSYVKFAARGH